MDERTSTTRPWRMTKVAKKILEVNFQGSILDFGCGKYCAQVKGLRKAGKHVDGYDIWFESHQSDIQGVHSRLSSPQRQYDLVAMSNVINVQRTPEELRETLLEAKAYVAPGGSLLMNYPRTPRKLDWWPRTMRLFVRRILDGELACEGELWEWENPSG